MVNLSKIIWIGVGILGVYVIVTKTNFLGSAIGYIQKKSPPMMPSMPQMPQPLPSSTTPATPPKPSPSAPQNIPAPQNQQSPTLTAAPPTPPDNSVVGQQPLIPQSVPGRGPTSIAPAPGTVGQNPNTSTGRNMKNMQQVPRNSNNQFTSQQPTIPQQVPGRGPTSTVQGPQLQGGQIIPVSFHSAAPMKGSNSQFPDCGTTNLQSGGSRPSCRKESDSVPATDYMITSTFNIAKKVAGKGTGRLEITSGGSGIGRTGCCGITLGLDTDTGQANAEIENWSPGGPSGRNDKICEGASCKPGINLGNLNGKSVQLTWAVSHSGGHVIYTGYANGMMFVQIMDPVVRTASNANKGKIVDPAKGPIQYDGKGMNEARLRIDNANATISDPIVRSL